MKIFILTHEYYYNTVYRVHTEEYIEEELEQKYLGIYSSEEKAQQAAERYYQLPGFNKYPFDYFYISEEEMDEDSGWTEGFVNWEGKYFSDIQDL